LNIQSNQDTSPELLDKFIVLVKNDSFFNKNLNRPNLLIILNILKALKGKDKNTQLSWLLKLKSAIQPVSSYGVLDSRLQNIMSQIIDSKDSNDSLICSDAMLNQWVHNHVQMVSSSQALADSAVRLLNDITQAYNLGLIQHSQSLILRSTTIRTLLTQRYPHLVQNAFTEMSNQLRLQVKAAVESQALFKDPIAVENLVNAFGSQITTSEPNEFKPLPTTNVQTEIIQAWRQKCDMAFSRLDHLFSTEPISNQIMGIHSTYKSLKSEYQKNIVSSSSKDSQFYPQWHAQLNLLQFQFFIKRMVPFQSVISWSDWNKINVTENHFLNMTPAQKDVFLTSLDIFYRQLKTFFKKNIQRAENRFRDIADPQQYQFFEDKLNDICRQKSQGEYPVQSLINLNRQLSLWAAKFNHRIRTIELAIAKFPNSKFKTRCIQQLVIIKNNIANGRFQNQQLEDLEKSIWVNAEFKEISQAVQDIEQVMTFMNAMIRTERIPIDKYAWIQKHNLVTQEINQKISIELLHQTHQRITLGSIDQLNTQIIHELRHQCLECMDRLVSFQAHFFYAVHKSYFSCQNIPMVDYQCTPNAAQFKSPPAYHSFTFFRKKASYQQRLFKIAMQMHDRSAGYTQHVRR
jgi:hypothetical protein